MNHEALPPSGGSSGISRANAKSSPRLFLGGTSSYRSAAWPRVRRWLTGHLPPHAPGAFRPSPGWPLSSFRSGQVGCGFVAAVGYWAGARWFNHRPSRLLLGNIVLVSLTTYFSIHHLDYTHAVVKGVAATDLMSFPDYLIAVTENMTYTSPGLKSGVELGRWGWGVAGLQVIGFCAGGVFVYRMLTAIPYCDRCAEVFQSGAAKAGKLRERPGGDARMLRSARQANERRAVAVSGDRLSMPTLWAKARDSASAHFSTWNCENAPNVKAAIVEAHGTGVRRGRQFATVGVLATPTGGISSAWSKW